MADEDTILEEAMDNLKEAGQRIMATQSLMRSQGLTDGSKASSPSLGSEDAPGNTLAIVSSATVASKDVLSCVVGPGGSSLLGPPAKIPLS